jgi:hypothetical protein
MLYWTIERLDWILVSRFLEEVWQLSPCRIRYIDTVIMSVSI